jgi:hypothetical protein
MALYIIQVLCKLHLLEFILRTILLTSLIEPLHVSFESFEDSDRAPYMTPVLYEYYHVQVLFTSIYCACHFC